MEQVTLTAINRYQKTSAAGKPYTSVSITTEEHGGRKISGFGNKDNESWKAGDTVEIEIESKGEYLNFSTPKSTFSKTPGAPDLLRLERKIDAVLTEIQMSRTVLGDILSKVDKVDLGDSPF